MLKTVKEIRKAKKRQVSAAAGEVFLNSQVKGAQTTLKVESHT